MGTNSRETILAAARQTAQLRGYNGLNFRDLARDVGIKSASIHYYFPSKADLGAAVARRYWEDTAAAFEKAQPVIANYARMTTLIGSAQPARANQPAVKAPRPKKTAWPKDSTPENPRSRS